ncbi:monocarboxylate transporter 2 isoform X1 [Hippocampus comes]|uniref:monocarboxylate transporter 2 isoform X1 n=2 Tax=Hippocampus comes TaxID=109280 RepID=UPI00094E9354|nr:PREDICTED: monocarboxylate transporter 2-like isoform X1 [Hippocampus comes]XP_019720781.1 PREDICTED: monocarboxylate transporter 2-like isoform X1 [Hippocampus comes]XP_019720782.1 PREDICTED: monocarboxylate transporter 2-like isoform X1 [Hippocampus comes]
MRSEAFQQDLSEEAGHTHTQLHTSRASQFTSTQANMAAKAASNLGYIPPDGGWGWAVVLASFISIGFAYAFPKSLTIYYKEIQEYFSVSYSQIAWVSSVMLASMYAAGPVSSILVNRYGSRPVVMVGGLMVCSAMVLASFGTSIVHLYLCVGVIGGFGLAFNLQPALTIIGTYFHAKRPLANGLAMTGSPVVLFTLAPLNQFLFDSFGWRGSFLILGALVLNCCVAGSLMRPVNKKVPAEVQSEPHESDGAQQVPEDNLQGVEIQNERREKGCIDVSLFKHRGFLIYLTGNVLMFFGFFAPVVFLAPYAKHLGVDEYSAAFLLSIFALVDMFVRPATGLLGNTKWIRPRIQYLFSFAVSYNGACHLLCPLASGYVGLVVYAVFFGMAFGMVCSLLFEVLMDLVGAHRFSSAVGLVTIIECGPVLLGPPLSGALVDILGDYKYMYYACGVFMLVPGIFFFIMHYYNYKRLDEEQRQQQSAQMRTCGEAVQLKMDQEGTQE